MAQKERPKRKPVQIAYKVGKAKKYKTPDANDLEVLQKIQALSISSPVPISEYPYADMWEAPRMMTRGITHVHHLFLERQLHAVSYMIEKARTCRNSRIKSMLLYWLDQSVAGLSVLNRYQPIMHGNPGGSQVNRQMSGVYYVPSQIAECSPWYNLSGKMDRLTKAFAAFNQFNNCANVGTGSTTSLPYPGSFLDYIFIDPPFGDNFPYAELNFFVESWLGVLTDMQPEAVVERSKQNAATQKKLPE